MVFHINFGYLLKAGQLEYDCRYSKMHGMPVTGGRGFRSLKPLWYTGVPPYVGTLFAIARTWKTVEAKAIKDPENLLGV